MNEHEAERIAAAIHQARPDWPTRSLRTLILNKMADRPRRDVFVALAWVASEPNSHTPARVLESGPWWRAAGVEGSAQPRNQVPIERRCGICSLDRDDCTRIWPDHEFRPIRDHKRTSEAMRQIIEDAKRKLERTRNPDEPPEVPPNPRVQAIREQLRGGGDDS